ncbi:MAG TPA: stage II sporulation protein M [Vicinamibacteria bacterium]|nr:stage II sporulation protein M [Vicinamibacteria bacterium]
MNKSIFLKERRPAWERFEKLLERAESRGGLGLGPDDVSEFSELFRALCYDLSQVRSRDWGSSVERFLNDLVVRGHGAFYRKSDRSQGRVLRFFTHSFPSRLRENHAFFWASLALFAVPLAVSWIVVASDPSLARRILPGSALYTMEQMYSGDMEETGRADAAMAGFYVRHNISIAFQCFALGVFIGVGTVYVLLSNGIQLGTVSGYIVGNGHAERFLGFVSGHSSFELSAIVVAGTAGLVLGHAIVAPGSFSRGEALRRRGRVAVEIALGAAAMLFVAALIEGFWSAQPLPAAIKYAVAGVFWIAVVSYLALAGRGEPRG